ncbi:MAG: TRAP transporter substrate-binding protein [Desulfovibrionaceae bacterium]|nr:TRAP transporter substrate-binding protein [Desulfovibrionaceae bacterium]
MLRPILTLLFLCFFLSSQAYAAPRLFRLGHEAAPQNPYGQGAVYFANLVKERSNGSLVIEVFPQGALGNQKELLEGVATGVIDMALIGTAILARIVPEVAVFDLPYLFRDIGHARKAADTIGLDLCRATASHGIYTLDLWENGFRHVTNNVRPIRSLRDMRGLRIRVADSPLSVETMNALAAAPTPMSLGEVYTALETGVIDGQESPLAHIATKEFYTVQSYLSLTSHSYSIEALVISAEVWKTLSPSDQEILRKAALDAKIWQRALCRALDTVFLRTIRASTTCVVNKDVDRKALANKARSVWKIYGERFGDASLKAIQAIQ